MSLQLSAGASPQSISRSATPESTPPSPTIATTVGTFSSSPKAVVALHGTAADPHGAYAFAKDAAEARRLAVEVAALQQALAQARLQHEAELTHAAEREAALSEQLSAAQQDARDDASREMTELGARAQVATWRTQQSQRQAEAAEAQLQATRESLRLMEAEANALRAELDASYRARDAVQAHSDALARRESELIRSIAAEREERKAELARLNGAASQALDEAKSETLSARRDHNDLRAELDRECEARATAEAAAAAANVALAHEAESAQQRIAEAQSKLATEREKLESDRMEHDARTKRAMEQVLAREGALEAGYEPVPCTRNSVV